MFWPREHTLFGFLYFTLRLMGLVDRRFYGLVCKGNDGYHYDRIWPIGVLCRIIGDKDSYRCRRCNARVLDRYVAIGMDIV